MFGVPSVGIQNPPQLVPVSLRRSSRTKTIRTASSGYPLGVQAGFLAYGHAACSYWPRLPTASFAAVASLRRSFPITAMAGMRWLETIFPFTGAAGFADCGPAPKADFSLRPIVCFVNFRVAGYRYWQPVGLPQITLDRVSANDRERVPAMIWRSHFPTGGGQDRSSVYCVRKQLKIPYPVSVHTIRIFDSPDTITSRAVPGKSLQATPANR